MHCSGIIPVRIRNLMATRIIVLRRTDIVRRIKTAYMNVVGVIPHIDLRVFRYLGIDLPSGSIGSSYRRRIQRICHPQRSVHILVIIVGIVPRRSIVNGVDIFLNTLISRQLKPCAIESRLRCLRGLFAPDAVVGW